jgi:flagellar L-ring protein precursor FlgH
MNPASRLCAIVLIGVFAAGCTPGVSVQHPTTARPMQLARAPQQNGAIFQDGVSYRPLFEDRRARYVGDTLTVNINEKTNASKNADGSATRNASVNVGIPVVQNLPLKSIQGTTLEGSADSKQESKEATSASNLFTGSVTVTVIDVLPNGNLVVSGEKQIGINNEVEKLRFSGVVNPMHIVNGNQVSSTSIADARIEVGSHSQVKPEQVLGFLARFFLSFFPFR